jgi:hypothetical protein
VENTLGGVNRDRRAAENNFKSVVVEVAKNHVADRQFERKRERFHFCPMPGADEVPRSSAKELAEIPPQSQVRLVQSQKLASLLALRWCTMPPVFGFASQVDS